MKKILLFLTALLLLLQKNLVSQFVLEQKQLDANNIVSYFVNRGIFNQRLIGGNLPGFEWPNNSGKYAIFTTGFNITAYVRGFFAMVSASYLGEYAPGYSSNGVAYTNQNFRIYKITRSEGINNPDWVNWGLMVPYGAPFVDVNNNGIYESFIDTPGVKNAAQTLFVALTDGFPSQRSSGEGFGGGVQSPLLYADLRITAWCYSQPSYSNMQFIKMVLINENLYSWDSVFTGIVCDPDIGDSNDNYVGCDTSLKLGYAYNKTAYDNNYGSFPPASGITVLKGLVNRNITPNADLSMTSFTFFTSTGSSPPPCESDPNGEPIGAKLMLKGLKKDGLPYMNPLVSPPIPTKFCYTGDPEILTGWTEYHGSIQNCGGTNGNYINQNPAGDRRYIMGMGAQNFKIFAGDTQIVLLCQMVTAGSNNRNSVTKLKELAVLARNFYNSNFTIGLKKESNSLPKESKLYPNFPNPFNPVTTIRFDVPAHLTTGENITLEIFDLSGKKVETVVNEQLSPGEYSVKWDASMYSSGVYFYRLKAGTNIITRKMILIK